MSKINKTNNVESFLKTGYDFLYNEITNKLVYRTKKETQYKEVDDFELNTILRAVKNSGEKRILKKEIGEILNSDFTAVFNPFKQYFDSLPEWKEEDGDFIEALADTVTVTEQEQGNWKEWFKKWITGVAASSYHDHIINQTVIVFTGKQGAGKTTWMKRLMPKSLDKYYYGGSINPGNKDTEIQLSENLLINLDELDNLSRKNISNLKEIITKPSIKIRRPYGTYAETMPRRASFMGSVNNREFLRDETGNRRFLCFETLSIDYNHLIDMDKVFAQAFQLVKNGHRYWFDDIEVGKVEEHNEAYKVVTIEQELLMKYFEPLIGNEEPDIQLETEDLFEILLKKSKVASRLSSRALGSALTKMNWPKKKTGGRRYWQLKEREVEQQED